MQEELFEQIKGVFSENERLFTKLHKIGQQYEAIDFDESGLYQDEEDIVVRRWHKLSNKIIHSLEDSLESTKVTIINTLSPENYLLSLQFHPEDEEATPFILAINYEKEGEVSILKD
ncbi:MAG: hypothetical protein U9R50_12415 [Campylobacterota bacterium]|nr:hypothetical protein [Campylobacterota bacterium]